MSRGGFFCAAMHLKFPTVKSSVYPAHAQPHQMLHFGWVWHPRYDTISYDILDLAFLCSASQKLSTYPGEIMGLSEFELSLNLNPEGWGSLRLPLCSPQDSPSLRQSDNPHLKAIDLLLIPKILAWVQHLLGEKCNRKKMQYPLEVS